MSVEQSDTIDLVSVDPESGSVVLTISDHLEWSDTVQHQQTLQRKLNTYLAFVEGGEIERQYPDAKGRTIRFEVILRYRPDRDGRAFLYKVKKIIEGAGFAFADRLFAESWNN